MRPVYQQSERGKARKPLIMYAWGEELEPGERRAIMRASRRLLATCPNIGEASIAELMFALYQMGAFGITETEENDEQDKPEKEQAKFAV